MQNPVVFGFETENYGVCVFFLEHGFVSAQAKLVSPFGRDVAQRQICALLPLIFSPPSAMMLFVSFRAGSNLLYGDKEAGALYSRRNYENK